MRLWFAVSRHTLAPLNDQPNNTRCSNKTLTQISQSIPTREQIGTTNIQTTTTATVTRNYSGQLMPSRDCRARAANRIYAAFLGGKTYSCGAARIDSAAAAKYVVVGAGTSSNGGDGASGRCWWWWPLHFVDDASDDIVEFVEWFCGMLWYAKIGATNRAALQSRLQKAEPQFARH